MGTSGDPPSGHISARSRGRLGELLAAIALEAVGADAILVDRDGYDIIANDPVAGLLRVEVKSAHRLMRKAPNSSYYYYNFMTSTGRDRKRRLNPEAVDVLAMVAVPERVTIFKPVTEVRGVTQKVAPHRFREPDVEFLSWQKTIRTILNNKGL